jgi:hypothetical protein
LVRIFKAALSPYNLPASVTDRSVSPYALLSPSLVNPLKPSIRSLYASGISKPFSPYTNPVSLIGIECNNILYSLLLPFSIVTIFSLFNVSASSSVVLEPVSAVGVSLSAIGGVTGGVGGTLEGVGCFPTILVFFSSPVSRLYNSSFLLVAYY